MRPLVSILIPAYNAEPWIAATLRSAITQSWEPKEIIVVDDGSTDRTLAIAQRFQSQCVRVVSQSNQGPSAARNSALALSKGDYIQWLDADDLLGPEKIMRQMEVIIKHRDDRLLLSGAWGHFMYRRHRATFVPTALWHDLSAIEWLLRKMEQNLYMANANWLVSRCLTQAAGPWDTRQERDNDGEYFCRVLLACSGVRFVPEAKVYYRRTGSTSVSNVGRSNAKLEATWQSLRLHIDYLRLLEDSPRTRMACVRLLQNWLIEFYPDRPDIVRQAEELAGACGGRLEVPKLSWKYAWAKALFGWQFAKHVQRYSRNLRWWTQSRWDKTLFLLGHRL